MKDIDFSNDKESNYNEALNYKIKDLTPIDKINILRILFQLKDYAFLNVTTRYMASSSILSDFINIVGKYFTNKKNKEINVITPATEWLVNGYPFIENRKEFDKIMIDLILSSSIKDPKDKDEKEEFDYLLSHAVDVHNMSLNKSKKNFTTDQLLNACCDVLALVYYEEIEVIDKSDTVLVDLFKETNGNVTLSQYLHRKIHG